jgi:hypothetical protein
MRVSPARRRRYWRLARYLAEYVLLVGGAALAVLMWGK